MVVSDVTGAAGADAPPVACADAGAAVRIASGGDSKRPKKIGAANDRRAPAIGVFPKLISPYAGQLRPSLESPFRVAALPRSSPKPHQRSGTPLSYLRNSFSGGEISIALLVFFAKENVSAASP
jgi:hypothetical protein